MALSALLLILLTGGFVGLVAGLVGVGGGIVTVLPGKFALASWSPGLNKKGNSLVGMQALELFTSQTGESLF